MWQDKVIDVPPGKKKDPCELCGTQRPCPDEGCISYKKFHGIPLDEEEKKFDELMSRIEGGVLKTGSKEPPYQDALDLWGLDSQFGMMFEETAELIEQAAKYQKALNQFRRGRISLDELLEELVDTDIMIEEMKVVLKNMHPEVDIEGKCSDLWVKKTDKFQSQVDKEKEKRGII